MNKLSTFSFEGKDSLVNFLETVVVRDGVECDVYEFTNDDSKDLGIIRISKGFQTPRQLVVEGDRTVEGFISGDAELYVTSGGEINRYNFTEPRKEYVDVAKGDIMKWIANEDSIVYEICIPSYEDGRFRNLD